MMMTSSKLLSTWSSRLLAVMTAALMMAVMVAPSVALAAEGGEEATPVEVKVRRAEVTADGATEIIVDVKGLPVGSLEVGDFTISEEDEAVSGVNLLASSQADNARPRSLMLAVDTSGSTAGGPLDAAIAAAIEFTGDVVERNVEVGVVSFAGEAKMLLEPTDDAAAVAKTLNGLNAEGSTAMWDGIVVSSRTLENFPGDRTVVLFTDGGDSNSIANLDGAATAVSTVGANLHIVSLETNDTDHDALDQLASLTDGEVMSVESASSIASAFDKVTVDLDSQYILTYPATGRDGKFDITVAVESPGGAASESVSVLNSYRRDAIGDLSEPLVRTVAQPGLLAGPYSGVVAGVALAIALAMLVLALFVPASDRRVSRSIQVASAKGDVARHRRDELSTTTSSLSNRAIEVVSRMPQAKGYEEKTQLMLNRAAWPMRSNEFTAIRGLAALVLLLMGALFWNFLVAFVLAGLGWVLPRVVLQNRVSKRQKRFTEQLPDTLQGVAGALRAGNSMPQAIETVVSEASSPTREEFRRVLTENSLGVPLGTAMNTMADRIGTDDFRWVAVAVNINIEIGGNMAELLNSIADTLRRRAAAKRKIQALSAEGRLSAIILFALPFLLMIYMWISNPSYLQELVNSLMGLIALGGAVLLMLGGVFWIRKIIDIEV